MSSGMTGASYSRSSFRGDASNPEWEFPGCAIAHLDGLVLAHHPRNDEVRSSLHSRAELQRSINTSASRPDEN